MVLIWRSGCDPILLQGLGFGVQDVRCRLKGRQLVHGVGFRDLGWFSGLGDNQCPAPRLFWVRRGEREEERERERECVSEITGYEP